MGFNTNCDPGSYLLHTGKAAIATHMVSDRQESFLFQHSYTIPRSVWNDNYCLFCFWTM